VFVSKSPAITEADILEDLVAQDQPGLCADVARSILELKFSKKATGQIRQLLRKNNLGTITAQERVALEKYLRVGQFLDIWQAKAKLSLKQSDDVR
jgi:hypothetical protein